MSGPASLLTEWARLLAATLKTAGVTDMVISPGSRSTPFAWAALQTDGLRCRSIADERDAAFFALGHARMTGRPVAVLCTSGSAPTHYFPAVVEASRSGTPLLVLTADRPFELQSADAPQTLDQVRLFGEFVRAFLDPGMPDADLSALRALQRTVAQALHRTGWPSPGPVHVNLRARKPLEPVTGGRPADRELRDRVSALIERGPTRSLYPRHIPDAGALGPLVAACTGASRGVIVCGPMASWTAPPPDRLLRLAALTGFAVLPEATSQARFRIAADGPTVVCDAFDTLLRSRTFRERFHPDVVLQIGPPPTSAGWRNLLGERASLERHVLALHEWSDPQGTARTIIPGMPSAAVDALVDALEARGAAAAGADDAWLDWLRSANALAWSAVMAAVAAEPETAAAEGRAVRTVIDALPAESVLGLGNSLPVREVDTFCRAGERGLTVWSQRGVSGIDGLVAGAAGAADATARPGALLLGDVSLLHDLGGLDVAADLDVPLAIVVLDNGGGRIFEQLPFAERRDPQLVRYWLTPPRLRFEAVAEAFGLRFRSAGRSLDLGRAVREALETPAATLIHARIAGDHTVTVQQAIWRAVEKAVAEAPAPDRGTVA